MNHPNLHPNPTRKRGTSLDPSPMHQQVTTSTIAPISRSALARIIHNPTRKRGTSNKIPRLRSGLRKTACF